MAGSDAIIVGNEWVSEHYFTTDAGTQSFSAQILTRRKAWEEAKATGTVRTRFAEQRGWLLDTLAGIAGAATGDDPILDDPGGVLPALYARLKDVLGYTGAGAVALKTETIGPVTWVTTPGMARGAPLVILDARAVTTLETLLSKDLETLTVPYVLEDRTEITSAARTLSTLFVTDDAPEYALVLAGRFLLLAERSRWPEGRYLAVDLQLVCERNEDTKGGEVDRALACVCGEALAPDADGEIWWSVVLEDSIKHTVGVSADLREGVRLSIEIIANDVLRRRAAAELDPLPAAEAQRLAKQALRFLYRILFLLYAEASPQLGVLPVGSSEYATGYSLDRLRDLTLVELADERSARGTHLYDSLHTLFRLVDRSTDAAGAEGQAPEGLQFRSLRADLFKPTATAHIEEVKLGNAALQEVLRHLLLTKETRGKDRGFISYAELGINQLGAVYEGLMSYTGFFATEDLFEVAKGGDASKGSWVVPTHRADHIDEADFVRYKDPQTGELKPVVHRTGRFVFRLAGRERQQSASYYTPEVLTRFVVSQALEELLDQQDDPEYPGKKLPTAAADILKLTICEPALGSGAFAVEAVRQLATQYLTRRQEETGNRIDPDAYPHELQKVKASIALHQVYGVDLNATAVELAEITLWLDTMVDGLDAPWFGLHLRRGNSLIGARRAVFTRDTVANKAWLVDTPRDVALTGLTSDNPDPGAEGRIHHFLLPSQGWGSAVDAKEAKELAPQALARLKEWRKTVFAKPSVKQVDALVDLGLRVETLWRSALHRLTIAEREIRRPIPVWGNEINVGIGAMQREHIEAALSDAAGAYQRLRRVMDAWCALWFWPLSDTLTTHQVEGRAARIPPPSMDAWIDALQMVLGRDRDKKPAPAGQLIRTGTAAWDALAEAEGADLGLAGVEPIDTVFAKHPWLRTCEAIAAQQGFFHWALDFAPVFARRGGFDLQLGNPPWVRPRSDVDALLAEGDPWWGLVVKPSESLRMTKRSETLDLEGMQEFATDGISDVAVTAAYLGSPSEYPHLVGLQPDLYRCFMERTWRNSSPTGVVTLIHPESHFTDEKAGVLRAATYARLRRHWHFLNERILFEIDDKASFGIHVYGGPKQDIGFLMATYIYHPEVVERSLQHDGSGPEPGLKDDSGAWDLRPHRNRLTHVDNDTLRTWHDALESEHVPLLQTRMLYAVNRSTASVLDKLAKGPRMGALGLRFSQGWHEKNDRTKGYFESSWGAPDSWDEVILQGPHLFVSTPIYKTPNETMLHNQDWSATDFEALAPETIPVTAYKPIGARYRYDCAYTDWGNDDDPLPARDYYRVAWRYMAANTGERTFIPAILPPGAAHTDGIMSAGREDLSAEQLLFVAATMSSMLTDLVIRTSPKSTIRTGTVCRLPSPRIEAGSPLRSEIVIRAARLNCVVMAYADLWEQAFDRAWLSSAWSNAGPGTQMPLSAVGSRWDATSPLRIAASRRKAQIEVDVAVALALGLSLEELCAVYRTQFAVLHGYDRNSYFYDVNGRLVPNSVLTTWRAKGGRITEQERTATNASGNTYTYEQPFTTLDREADMRQAYRYFEQLLRERS
jgi:hypothetical protein